MAHKKKFNRIWISAVVFHVLVLLFVVDMYFTSPVNHGMTVHRTNAPPFAKRLVLFVCDGLRAETIYRKGYEKRAPFITSLKKRSAWGTVHTRVPTESRPGHVAILAGIYEDPSAILTGWKANLVEFDSIINQSNRAWSYGSPDIVNIFPKKDSSKQVIDSYDPDQEDFSGKTHTTNLDHWVFKKVTELLTPQDRCGKETLLVHREKRSLLKLKTKVEEAEEICNDTACQVELREELNEKEANYKKLEDNLMYECPKYDLRLAHRDLFEDGNVFFLHLLGMDSAGHIHKPNSAEFLKNLLMVDKGIQQMEDLFRNFFQDDETVFVFTADHGMTNWGSHGDGTAHETEVPYVLWGKGITIDGEGGNMEQAQLTPLMASLIGIPIPINSIGVLKPGLLAGDEEQITNALLTNLKQLSEHYFKLYDDYTRDYFFHHYNVLFADKQNIMTAINDLEGVLTTKVYDQVSDICLVLITDILSVITYMKNYYFYPKMVCVLLGFVLWLISVALYLHSHFNVNEVEVVEIQRFQNCALTFCSAISITMAGYLYYIGSNVLSFAYPAFPILIFMIAITSENIIFKLFEIFYCGNKKMILFQALTYGTLNQLLVLGFTNKMFVFPVLLIIGLWTVFKNKHLSILSVKFGYFCVILGVFLFMPMNTKFNYIYTFIGGIIWFIVFRFKIYRESVKYIDHFVKNPLYWKLFATLPVLVFLVAVGNSYAVANNFDNENGLHLLSQIVSWTSTVAAILLIPFSPLSIYGRFGQICACLVIPYTLMNVNMDLIVYSIFVLTLYSWIELETYEFDVFNVAAYAAYDDQTSVVKPVLMENYRQTFFYVALLVSYVFAVGNVASFNGFDPLWTRAYLKIFNPFLMCGLIVVKLVIPLFVTTCAFRAINLNTKANSLSIFAIMLLYFDQMVITFMFQVKNEGSWKDIGESLSKFVIMEAFVLIIIAFYAIAGFVTRWKVHNVELKEKLKDDDFGEAVFLDAAEMRHKTGPRFRGFRKPSSTTVSDTDDTNDFIDSSDPEELRDGTSSEDYSSDEFMHEKPNLAYSRSFSPFARCVDVVSPNCFQHFSVCLAMKNHCMQRFQVSHKHQRIALSGENFTLKNCVDSCRECRRPIRRIRSEPNIIDDNEHNEYRNCESMINLHTCEFDTEYGTSSSNSSQLSYFYHHDRHSTDEDCKFLIYDD